MRHSAFILLLGLGGAFHSATALSQSVDGSLAPTYSIVEQQSAWLTGVNPAGLWHLKENVSEAEVGFTKRNGGLVNYYQSDNSYTAGIGARSLYRLNSSTVFAGSFGYDYSVGKNMSGSALINPYAQPFDIVEADESNAGTKKLENYRLTGAVSVDLGHGLHAGGELNFRAANYAKTKDLRHKNKLSELDLNVGLTYRLSPAWEIGAAYIYNRSVEGVLFSMNGTSDKQYTSLVSYGAFWGKSEIFGDTGYTKSSDEKPFFNSVNGGALQLSFTPSKSADIYLEAGYHSRTGYYGNKSSGSIVYSEHGSDIYQVKATLTVRGSRSLHTVTAGGSFESLSNDETVYNTQTVNGITTTQYFTPIRVLDRDERNVYISYIGQIGMRNLQPAWTVEAGASQYYRELTASVHPYYRKQNVTSNSVYAGATRHFSVGGGTLSTSIRLGGNFGSGDLAIDGLYATPSSTQTAPKSQVSMLNEEFEYLTKTRISVAPTVRYAHSINKSVSGYASAGYSLEKASDVEWLHGDKQHVVKLTVGCIF